jgi:hypothetical protein
MCFSAPHNAAYRWLKCYKESRPESTTNCGNCATTIPLPPGEGGAERSDAPGEGRASRPQAIFPQRFAPASHVGQHLVPTVRARVSRGTAPRPDSSCPRPKSDSASSQCFVPASHVGQRLVPMLRARVPRGTAPRPNGSRPRPTSNGASSQWFGLASHVGQRFFPMVWTRVRGETAPRPVVPHPRPSVPRCMSRCSARASRRSARASQRRRRRVSLGRIRVCACRTF